nr:unnamed protein product [Digitaria exilis]
MTPHVSLRDIADEHGGLVVSSPSAAEAVLRAHDHAMASRPPSPVADILLSGASDVALAPYGHHWRQARKLVTAHLLSATKVHSLTGMDAACQGHEAQEAMGYVAG